MTRTSVCCKAHGSRNETVATVTGRADGAVYRALIPLVPYRGAPLVIRTDGRLQRDGDVAGTIFDVVRNVVRLLAETSGFEFDEERWDPPGQAGPITSEETFRFVFRIPAPAQRPPRAMVELAVRLDDLVRDGRLPAWCRRCGGELRWIDVGDLLKAPRVVVT